MTLLLVLAYAVGNPGVATPAPAWADTTPPEAAIPTTVSSDPLPTAQIDGVVWNQVVVGDTVYAGGNFQTARPAGAPAGSQTVARPYLLAYNLTTGVLVPTFAPTLNGQVRAVVASADGSTLYVGGDFTTVNGVSRTRLAAFDTKTGALKAGFTPVANAMVKALAVTTSTLYLAGNFTTIGGATRTSVGAVDATTGAVTGFNPVVTGGYGESVAVPPKDTSKVVIGGRFVTTNGSTNPGYGLAMVDSATGRTNLPLAVNGFVRNAQNKAAITSLYATADGFYGTAFSSDGAVGNFEGTFKATWGGDLTWVEDCHGDTYSVFQPSGVTSPVYIAGHPHYCGNIGGFPQNGPQSQWTFDRALAFTPDVKGVVGRDPFGYTSWTNYPRPDLLSWFPDVNVGTFTGQFQGPWTVTGTVDYVVYGGEFTAVNGTPQQGIVRFARPGIAPNADGPRLSGASFVPTLQSFANGVRVVWPANYDRDNEQLTYTVIRDGVTATPVFTTTRRSTHWQQPVISFLDAATKSGSHTYRVVATDPHGNRATGNDVAITAGSGTSLSPYDQRVLNDDPTYYWPLAETSGTATTDFGGRGGTGTRQAAVTTGVPGAIAGDSGTAYRFAGIPASYASTSTATQGLQTLSVETWFKTTSTAGGRLIGFSSNATGSSTTTDRHLYLTDAGRVAWGTARPSAKDPGLQTLSTPGTGYNNGQWHHVVAVQDPKLGSQLFVDGDRVAFRSDYFLARVGTGYWRLGGDTLATWPERPSSDYYSGDLDDPAVYNVALTSAQVLAHYRLGSGGAPPAGVAFAADNFNRTVPSGFGTADTGGAWTASATYNTVTGGAGLYKLAPGVGPATSLATTKRTSTDLTTNITVDKAATGSGLYLAVVGRQVSGTLDYQATVQLTSTGRATLTLGALKGSSASASLAPTVLLPDQIVAGSTFHLRLQTSGSSPTTIRAKLWLNGQSEPADWAVTATDSYAALQTSGSFGMSAYASPNITNAPVTVSLLDFTAKPA